VPPLALPHSVILIKINALSVADLETCRPVAEWQLTGFLQRWPWAFPGLVQLLAQLEVSFGWVVDGPEFLTLDCRGRQGWQHNLSKSQELCVIPPLECHPHLNAGRVLAVVSNRIASVVCAPPSGSTLLPQATRGRRTILIVSRCPKQANKGTRVLVLRY